MLAIAAQDAVNSQELAQPIFLIAGTRIQITIPISHTPFQGYTAPSATPYQEVAPPVVVLQLDLVLPVFPAVPTDTQITTTISDTIMGAILEITVWEITLILSTELLPLQLPETSLEVSSVVSLV